MTELDKIKDRVMRLKRSYAGQCRVDSMTDEELSASSAKAAKARWAAMTAEERSIWRRARVTPKKYKPRKPKLVTR